MNLILRIDDVGRLPSDPPEQGSDKGLAHFREWREAAGLVGLPAVYGCVPAWIDDAGRDYLGTFCEHETIAVHGITHVVGEETSAADLERARRHLLGATAYIAPFNLYGLDTLRNWRKAGGEFFLGGFYGEHHQYGCTPSLTAGVIHLSADFTLYGRSWELMEAVKLPSAQPIRVLTLHVPWETKPDALRTFVDGIRDSLAPLIAVRDFTYSSGM